MLFILLEFIKQIPELIGAVAMARAGLVQGAISSSLASQIMCVTIAFGLPWTIAIATGMNIIIEDSNKGKIVDFSLIGLLAMVIFTFITVALLSPSKFVNGVEINRTGSIVMLCVFTASAIGFFIIEALTELGFIY